MTTDSVSKLIADYQNTHDPGILARIVDRYCELTMEEPIEWMEELIDASTESVAIERAINQRYVEQGQKWLRDLGDQAGDPKDGGGA